MTQTRRNGRHGNEYHTLGKSLHQKNGSAMLWNGWRRKGEVICCDGTPIIDLHPLQKMHPLLSMGVHLYQSIPPLPKESPVAVLRRRGFV